MNETQSQNPTKKKVGRPPKPYKTKTHPFRFDPIMLDFLRGLTRQNLNANEFVRQLIRNCKEYQIYLEKKAEEDLKNQPKLFD